MMHRTRPWPDSAAEMVAEVAKVPARHVHLFPMALRKDHEGSDGHGGRPRAWQGQHLGPGEGGDDG